MSYKQFRLTAGKPIEASVRGKVLLVDSTGAADGIDITLRHGGKTIELPNRQKAFKMVADFDTVILLAAVDCTVALFLSMDDVSLGFSDAQLFTMKGEVRVTNDADNPVAVAIQPGADVAIISDADNPVSVDIGQGAAVTIANDAANRVPVELPAGAVVVIGNDAGQRIPVDIGGATVNITAESIGIDDVTLVNTDDNAVPMRVQALTGLVHLPAVVVNTGAAQAIVSDATLRKLRIRNASAGASVGLGGAGVSMENAAIILAPGDMWTEDDAAGAAWYAVSDTDGASVRVMGAKR